MDQLVLDGGHIADQRLGLDFGRVDFQDADDGPLGGGVQGTSVGLGQKGVVAVVENDEDQQVRLCCGVFVFVVDGELIFFFAAGDQVVGKLRDALAALGWRVRTKLKGPLQCCRESLTFYFGFYGFESLWKDEVFEVNIFVFGDLVEIGVFQIQEDDHFFGRALVELSLG